MMQLQRHYAERVTPYAAQFGKTVDRGSEGGEQAFPFIYGLVPKDKDQWENLKNPATTDNFSGTGIVIPKGTAANPGRVDVGVTLDPDYNFKLLRIKYTFYNFYPGQNWTWHAPIMPFLDPMEPMGCVHYRLDKYITVNLSWLPQGEYVYGTPNSFTQQTSTRAMIPLSVDASQGNEYGPGSFNTPILLPANGLLRFEFFNTYNGFNPIVVCAAIYGLKVRL